MKVIAPSIAFALALASVSLASRDDSTDAKPAGESEPMAAPAAQEEPAAAVPAQSDAPADAQEAAKQKAMEEFLYSVLVGRKERAETNAKFLLDSGATNRQLAQMVDGAGYQERLTRAVRAAKGMGDVAELASQIEVRVAAGRLELARDLKRIDEAVRQLGGTMRQQSMAKGTLTAAGAYAVPALLKAMRDDGNPQLALRATQTLIAIGRGAVLPLSEVLVTAAPPEQVAICNMLTAINSKLAAPWLAKTVRLASSSDVRLAAEATLRSLKSDGATELGLWTSLARDYFVSRDALTPYPGEPTQVVWSVESSGTIEPKLVPTDIYGDLMAKRCAEEAMRLDPAAVDALSIYLAAGLRSETAIPEEERSAHSMLSITLAAGSAQAERVLKLARDVNDPGLTMIAIHILAKTASESMLVDSKAGSPILGCLSNPSRTIRTAAALAIGHAMPEKAFPSSDRVVPILAAAVQQGSAPRVVVIAADESQRRELEGRLPAIGCALLSSDASAPAVLSTLAGRGAPDMIVASGGADEMKAAMKSLRGSSALAATPILLAIPEADEVRIDRSIRQDPSVVVWFQGRSEAEFQAAAKQLMGRTIGVAAAGADIAAESKAQQQEALQVLRTIGQMQVTPLKVSDASRDLIDALQSTTEETQILVARVLAVTPTTEAQRALINAALTATEAQQIVLLQLVAESGRRYGNQAEEKQIDRLRQALTDAKGANADALSEAYGALNVGTAQVLKLILH
ncbi:MAG: HEAT repeat domain-containing protein [Planctomycetes bacterium]|nr:HEAT repeat domain-containing protein [Planctomycetota bacterium]